MKRIELYDPEALPKKRARRKTLLAVMLGIGGIGLFVCILLCVLTTRKNYMTMLPLTIAASVLAGWIVITLLHGSFGNANADVRHWETMLREPRETQRGRFEKTGDVQRVRNGMTVRRVRFFEEERERVLSVSEHLADRLPDAFSGTVETVYDFIVAYEENGDD
jgi:hypothetical protein